MSTTSGRFIWQVFPGMSVLDGFYTSILNDTEVVTDRWRWLRVEPDLIATIFTPDATYHERVLQEPIRTRAGIRKYWETKVIAEQANIAAELLALYRDGETVIAEWEATFDDLVQSCRKRMRDGSDFGVRRQPDQALAGMLGVRTAVVRPLAQVGTPIWADQ